jgi:hypothetical protein
MRERNSRRPAGATKPGVAVVGWTEGSSEMLRAERSRGPDLPSAGREPSPARSGGAWQALERFLKEHFFKTTPSLLKSELRTGALYAGDLQSDDANIIIKFHRPGKGVDIPQQIVEQFLRAQASPDAHGVEQASLTIFDI